MRQTGSLWRDVERATGVGRSSLRKRMIALELPYSRRYTRQEKRAVVDLRNQGVEWKHIARAIGKDVDPTSIRQVFRRCVPDVPVTHRPFMREMVIYGCRPNELGAPTNG